MNETGVKILFLIRSLEAGGAERQLVNLARGLAARGYGVTIAVFYAGGAFEAQLGDAGVVLCSLEKRGRWDLPGFFVRLVRLVRNERPDILHGYLPMANILALLCKPLRRGLKVVWGIRASDMDLARYDRLARIEFRLAQYLARGADLIVANSEAGRVYHVARGYPVDRLVVIRNGVDTGRFCPDADAGRRQRAAWGIDGHQRLIGLIARLDPMKDHPNFLHAAALAVRDRTDLHFVCVGRGDPVYGQRLEALAADLGIAGRLTWDGAATDMVAVYNALDIAVSASAFGEGFSNALAEAMACGVPCVTTDVGDAASIVAGTGVVVRRRDSQALAAGMIELMHRREQETAMTTERARRRIVAHYGVEALVDATAAAFAALVSSGAGGAVGA